MGPWAGRRCLPKAQGASGQLPVSARCACQYRQAGQRAALAIYPNCRADGLHLSRGREPRTAFGLCVFSDAGCRRRGSGRARRPSSPACPFWDRTRLARPMVMARKMIWKCVHCWQAGKCNAWEFYIPDRVRYLYTGRNDDPIYILIPISPGIYIPLEMRVSIHILWRRFGYLFVTGALAKTVQRYRYL